MTILYFGDIVGKVGRAGVRKVLSSWKEEYNPDLILANAENLAHGAGITPKTINEMREAGIEYFTSGNHIWDKPNGEEVLQDESPVVIRPLNYGSKRSGQGFLEIEKDGKKILLLNLQGQAFMPHEVDNPFTVANDFFEEYPPEHYDAVFVDFHAETTSEKVAMGWHLDGRASVIVGSHTHVPTADEKILPNGTAYQTDVGMVGPKDSVIGVDKDSVLSRFIGGEKMRFEYAEEGTSEINAVLVTVGDKGKATDIQRLHAETEV